MLLQACLNGSRRPAEHAALPLTPAQVAADAAAVRRAGAGCIHVHPRREDGRESLSAEDVAAVVDAVRSSCPGLAIGVTTAAWIEPDPERRRGAIGAWTVLPDFASVNLSEEGAQEVVGLLCERGIGVEAGVWSEDDARLLIELGMDAACLRVLVEVEPADPGNAAVSLAAAIDAVLDESLSQAPRLHHGAGPATWNVLAAAMAKGHDVRVGLEDVLVLPDGARAPDNAALVGAARLMAAAAGRAVEW